MKRLNSTKILRTALMLLLMACITIGVSAKNKRDVRFTLDSGLFAMDYVTCNVEKQGNSYFLVTSTYWHDIIADNPTLKIRTFDGDVLTLTGKKIGEAKFVSKENDRDHYAQFRITPQQFEKIKSGIKRFRISPVSDGAVDKEFKNRKIGKKIYKLYLKAKDF